MDRKKARKPRNSGGIQKKSKKKLPSIAEQLRNIKEKEEETKVEDLTPEEFEAYLIREYTPKLSALLASIPSPDRIVQERARKRAEKEAQKKAAIEKARREEEESERNIERVRIYHRMLNATKWPTREEWLRQKEIENAEKKEEEEAMQKQLEEEEDQQEMEEQVPDLQEMEEMILEESTASSSKETEAPSQEHNGHMHYTDISYDPSSGEWDFTNCTVCKYLKEFDDFLESDEC